MRTRTISLILIIFIALGAGTFAVIKLAHPSIKKEARKILFYKNPMNPSITSPVPTKDEMGMDYIPVYEETKKVLFYRNPMNPNITSPVPAKDEMGMDYIPVYENKDTEPGISISDDRQKLAGIKTEKVQVRPFTLIINASGKVAYDPDLYVAQSEYLQTLKMITTLKNSSSSTDLSTSLLNAGRRKLQLMGMSADQINELEKSGVPQEDLALSGSLSTVWIYLQVFEKDIGLVKTGMSVNIESVAYPGTEFEGKVASIAPVLDPETRSVQIRVRVPNTDHKLKPEMFISGKIMADQGNKLSVPEEAVVDTGERKIVFKLLKDGRFGQKEIRTGFTSNGYAEIVSGLEEGDVVVSSGVFFVDSESRLKSGGDQ